MVEDADSTVCTYARIATVEMQIPRDLLDYWQEPSSFFIMSGEQFFPKQQCQADRVLNFQGFVRSHLPDMQVCSGKLAVADAAPLPV